jgi:hypothetical protein
VTTASAPSEACRRSTRGCGAEVFIGLLVQDGRRDGDRDRDRDRGSGR